MMPAPSVRECDASRGVFGLGPGWLSTISLVWLYATLVILPGHALGSGAANAALTTITAAYAGIVSLVAPRLARGVVLRMGGARDPILVLGRGPDALLSTAIRPRSRLLGIGAGAIASALLVAAGAALVVTAQSATYAHAVGGLVLVFSALLLVAAFVPAPGFVGWGAVVAIVDALGTPPDVRIGRAARVARTVAVPMATLAGFAAAAIGDPFLLPLGIGLALLIEFQVRAAVHADAFERFLARRTASDLARLVTAYTEADDGVDQLRMRPDGAPGVTAVTENGGLVGAIGSLQVRASGGRSRNKTCGQIMVSIPRLSLLPADAPAAALIAGLARYGFALVRTPEGLGYVEVSDLVRQMEIETMLRARAATVCSARAHAEGGDGRSSEDERETA